MKLTFSFKWYDCWIGFFFDTGVKSGQRAIYFCPFFCCCFKIALDPDPPKTLEDDSDEAIARSVTEAAATAALPPSPTIKALEKPIEQYFGQKLDELSAQILADRTKDIHLTPEQWLGGFATPRHPGHGFFLKVGTVTSACYAFTDEQLDRAQAEQSPIYLTIRFIGDDGSTQTLHDADASHFLPVSDTDIPIIAELLSNKKRLLACERIGEKVNQKVEEIKFRNASLISVITSEIATEQLLRGNNPLSPIGPPTPPDPLAKIDPLTNLANEVRQLGSIAAQQVAQPPNLSPDAILPPHIPTVNILHKDADWRLGLPVTPRYISNCFHGQVGVVQAIHPSGHLTADGMKILDHYGVIEVAVFGIQFITIEAASHWETTQKFEVPPGVNFLIPPKSIPPGLQLTPVCPANLIF